VCSCNIFKYRKEIRKKGGKEIKLRNDILKEETGRGIEIGRTNERNEGEETEGYKGKERVKGRRESWALIRKYC
jgi:hypothetical protein